MKIRKLGIEWGSAYEEAQPHTIEGGMSDERVVVEIFELEGFEGLGLVIPPEASLTMNARADGGIYIRITR